MLGWIESDHLRLGAVVRHGAKEVLYRREVRGAPCRASWATHAVRCIKEAHRRRMTRVEIGQGPHERYFLDVQRRQQNTVFVNHSCASSNSYYFDKHGDAPMLRPSTTMEMLWRARHFPMKHYRFSRARAGAAAEPQDRAAATAA